MAGEICNLQPKVFCRNVSACVNEFRDSSLSPLMHRRYALKERITGQLQSSRLNLSWRFEWLWELFGNYPILLINGGQLAWVDFQMGFLPLPLFFALETFQICSVVSSGQILFLNVGEIRPDVGITARGLMVARITQCCRQLDCSPSMLGFASSSS